jgi:phosphoribosylformimino-5-aminoimidazole carboxamide ribotide isomerase
MELIAAIDLLDGGAVRLLEGDYDRPIARVADAPGLAASWARAGVRRLHVVDLEGARAGRPAQLELATRVADAARSEANAGPITVELGGGLRTLGDLSAAFEAGIDEAILGTAAVESPELVAEAAARWPGRIGASLDLRDLRVAVDGWTRTTDTDAFALARTLVERGAARLTLTDARRDGTLAGPNVELLARFRDALPDAVLVAAGGVGAVEDLAALARIGMDGAIVGRALVDGSLSVADALAAVQQATPGAAR